MVDGDRRGEDSGVLRSQAALCSGGIGIEAGGSETKLSGGQAAGHLWNQRSVSVHSVERTHSQALYDDVNPAGVAYRGFQYDGIRSGNDGLLERAHQRDELVNTAAAVLRRSDPARTSDRQAGADRRQGTRTDGGWRMKTRNIVLTAILILAAAAFAYFGLVRRQPMHASGPVAASPDAGDYYCPMHPTYHSDKPGNCPICSMKLVKLDRPTGNTPPPVAHTAPNGPTLFPPQHQHSLSIPSLPTNYAPP